VRCFLRRPQVIRTPSNDRLAEFTRADQSSKGPVEFEPFPSHQKVRAGGSLPTRLQIPSREAASDPKKLKGGGYRLKPRCCCIPHQMRRVVIFKEHLDNDSEEAADFRHK
jgi:hypothetical protein